MNYFLPIIIISLLFTACGGEDESAGESRTIAEEQLETLEETIINCQAPYDMKLYTDIRDKNTTYKNVVTGEITHEVLATDGNVFTVKKNNNPVSNYRYDETGIYLTNLDAVWSTSEVKYSNRYACVGDQYVSKVCTIDAQNCLILITDVIEHRDNYDNGFDTFEDVLKMKQTILQDNIVIGETVSYQGKNIGDVYTDDITDSEQIYQSFKYQKLDENLDIIGQNIIDSRWKVTQKKDSSFFIARVDKNQISAIQNKQTCNNMNYGGQSWRVTLQDEISLVQEFQKEYGIDGKFWNVTYDSEYYWTSFGLNPLDGEQESSANAYCIYNQEITHTIKTGINSNKNIIYESDLNSTTGFNPITEKWYRIVMPEAGNISLVISGDIISSNVLYNGNETLIAKGKNIFKSLDAGEYLLKVNSYSYSVPSVTILLPFDDKSSFIEEIGKGVHFDMNDSKLYKFTVFEDGNANISLSGPSYSKYFHLLDSRFNNVGLKRTGPTSTYKYYQEKLKAGEYYIAFNIDNIPYFSLAINSPVISMGNINKVNAVSNTYTDQQGVVFYKVSMNNSGYIDLSANMDIASYYGLDQLIVFDEGLNKIDASGDSSLHSGVIGGNYFLNAGENTIKIVTHQSQYEGLDSIPFTINSPELDYGEKIEAILPSTVVYNLSGTKYYKLNFNEQSSFDISTHGYGVNHFSLHTPDMKLIIRGISSGGSYIFHKRDQEKIGAGEYILKVGVKTQYANKPLLVINSNTIDGGKITPTLLHHNINEDVSAVKFYQFHMDVVGDLNVTGNANTYLYDSNFTYIETAYHIPPYALNRTLEAGDYILKVVPINNTTIDNSLETVNINIQFGN